MEFTVEFYETEGGKCPVREFLDELKGSDPDDFAAVRNKGRAITTRDMNTAFERMRDWQKRVQL